MRKHVKSLLPLAAACLLFASASPCLAEAAAVMKPAGAIQHVLLISVDGLHATDLANYVSKHPDSALAELSGHGLTYSHASASLPSDSFPGLLALLTGGSPNSTGVFYDDSYDRKLLPPVSFKQGDKPGTEVVYDETVDMNPDALDGGGGINPDNLPRDPITKKPVYPHQFLRANTVFEVLRAAGLHTAWSDKHPAYDLINGPSGTGVEDLYTPEINANGITDSVAATETYDDLKVKAVLNEIDGKDHSGQKSAPVPALFGMNFQEVSVAQKLPHNGYLDAGGTPSDGLADALGHTDQSLRAMVDELKKQKLFDSTLIVVTAKHGQSPIDPSLLKIIDKKTVTDGISPELIAQVTADDVALIWLTDQSRTAEVAAKIAENTEKAAIGHIYTYSKDRSKWPFNNPAEDSRAPDIVVQPQEGVVYTKPGKKIAEHGGFSTDDTNVALLLSYSGVKAVRMEEPVQTMQVAPTILQTLGLSPDALQAVRNEHTKALPGSISISKSLPDVLNSLEAAPDRSDLYETAMELFNMSNDKGYKIIVNGKLKNAYVVSSAKNVQGRTTMSAQELADDIGAQLLSTDNKTVAFSSNGKTVKLTVGSTEALVNGSSALLDVPAANGDNGKLAVPVRFVAEALGKQVSWTASGNIIIVSIIG